MIIKINKKNYRKGVFIIVYKIKNKKINYLILKRKLHWNGFEFPKGGIEKGETILDAVKRETHEETGLKIEKIINHGIKGKYEYDKKIPGRENISGQTYSLYSAKVNNGKVSIDKHEDTKYYWLNYKESLKILSKKNQKDCLKIVNRKIASHPFIS